MTQVNTQKTQAQTTLNQRTCKNPTLLFIKQALTKPCLLKASNWVLSDFVERNISWLIFSEGIRACVCVIGNLDHWFDHPQMLIPRLAKYASVCLWVSSRDCGITHGGENRRWAYVAGGGLWAGGGGGDMSWELSCLASPVLLSAWVGKLLQQFRACHSDTQPKHTRPTMDKLYKYVD